MSQGLRITAEGHRYSRFQGTMLKGELVKVDAGKRIRS